jgi:hypothetical protein
MRKIAGSGSIRKRQGSADPYQNVKDPQHWSIEISLARNECEKADEISSSVVRVTHFVSRLTLPIYYKHVPADLWYSTCDANKA